MRLLEILATITVLFAKLPKTLVYKNKETTELNTESSENLAKIVLLDQLNLHLTESHCYRKSPIANLKVTLYIHFINLDAS